MRLTVLAALPTLHIAETTGLDVACAWADERGGRSFATADHRHGWFDPATGAWGWQRDPVVHGARCLEQFPQDFDAAALSAPPQ